MDQKCALGREGRPFVVVRLVVALVFAVIAKVSDPEPARPVPFWKVRKVLALVALQVQLACVVTVIVPLAAASDTLIVVGLIE